MFIKHAVRAFETLLLPSPLRDTDFSSSPSDNDIVEVGMKTGVSVVATAHDARASLTSDEGGCGEYGYGGCEPMLTRDGITSEIESRWSCATKIVEDEGPCEIEFIFDEPQDIVDIEVAFWMGDERTRTLEVSRVRIQDHAVTSDMP